jgi:hypothetical protein
VARKPWELKAATSRDQLPEGDSFPPGAVSLRIYQPDFDSGGTPTQANAHRAVPQSDQRTGSARHRLSAYPPSDGADSELRSAARLLSSRMAPMLPRKPAPEH